MINQKRAWLAVLSAILAGIAIAFTQNKAIQCISQLMETFSVSRSSAGWLSSVFCIMGIVSAFPAAAVTNRLGVKWTCLLSLFFGIIGTIWGVLSHSFGMLLVGRIVEGIGAGLISIAVPSIIAMWFPPEKRGLPTGLWSAWQNASQTLCFLLGYSIVSRFQWQGMWYLGLFILVPAAVLCLLFVKNPENSESVSTSTAGNRNVLDSLHSNSTWLVCLVMLLYCFLSFSYVTWIVQCWNDTLGISLEIGSRYLTYQNIIALPIVVLSGVFMNRVNHIRFCSRCIFLYGVLSSFGYILPGKAFIIPLVILYPFMTGSIATALWTIIPLTAKKPEHVAGAVALFTLTSNVGMLLGPPAIGFIIDHFGWSIVALVTILITVITYALLRNAKEYV